MYGSFVQPAVEMMKESMADKGVAPPPPEAISAEKEILLNQKIQGTDPGANKPSNNAGTATASSKQCQLKEKKETWRQKLKWAYDAAGAQRRKIGNPLWAGTVSFNH